MMEAVLRTNMQSDPALVSIDPAKYNSLNRGVMTTVREYGSQLGSLSGNEKDLAIQNMRKDIATKILQAQGLNVQDARAKILDSGDVDAQVALNFAQKLTRKMALK